MDHWKEVGSGIKQKDRVLKSLKRKNPRQGATLYSDSSRLL